MKNSITLERALGSRGLFHLKKKRILQRISPSQKEAPTQQI